MENVITLFRPVGQRELDLVRESGFREFPARLRSQAYFYPVTNIEYATQIARDWNTKDSESGHVGYVLRFAVREEFLKAYPIRQVGDVKHREYWIPATELAQFNQNIVGLIEVVAEFHSAESK